MRVHVAPDKFKGCLTAGEVATALADGLQARRPDLQVVQPPVADGGEGTVAAAHSAGFTVVEVDAVGPIGLAARTRYAVRGSEAVVELSDVVGLARLPQGRLDPLGSSTFGLGVVIRHALDRGADEIVLGLGGSASTGGGAGPAQLWGHR